VDAAATDAAAAATAFASIVGDEFVLCDSDTLYRSLAHDD
jgi:hypothetical protein